jgi:hypothetical protein
MHRAFLLPEIVAIVLEIGETEPGFLFNCLTVNKIFFDEACRILWETCDSSGHGQPQDPKIRTLGNMVLRADAGPERAQLYADHIQNLDFRYEDDDFEKTDARWHPVLRKLKFPKLRSLYLYPSDAAKSFNTGDALLHYAQPNLQFFDASCATQLSNGFLERLITQSPGLQELHLRSDDDTISKSDLERCLSKASNLEQFVLETGKEKVWSSATFMQMSRCPKLYSFNIPELIEEEWIGALGSPVACDPFPDLQHVTAGMTTGAVERLSMLRPNIESLRISNKGLGSTQDMLAAASRFPQLKFFTFSPDVGSHLTGQEMTQIAQGCPNLEEFKIGDDKTPLPTTTGVTDDVIRSLAQALPKLQELHLTFSSDTRPSIGATITSLSRHCPDLALVEMSCQRDWMSVMSVPDEVSFPNLNSLTLHLPNKVISDEDRNAVVKRIDEHFGTWFPELDYLDFQGYRNELEDTLESLVVNY